MVNFARSGTKNCTFACHPTDLDNARCLIQIRPWYDSNRIQTAPETSVALEFFDLPATHWHLAQYAL